MKRIGPCCFGIPLKRAVKLIALIEVIGNFICAISTVFLLASIGNPQNRENELLANATENKNPTSTKAGKTLAGLDHGHEYNQLGTMEFQSSHQESALVLLLILLISEIALSWILYRGASQEKFRHLRAWWWIKLILMIVFLLFDMVDAFTGENRKLEYVICLQVLYQGYVLWVVRALIDEIRGIGPPRFTPLTTPRLHENDINDV